MLIPTRREATPSAFMLAATLSAILISMPNPSISLAQNSNTTIVPPVTAPVTTRIGEIIVLGNKTFSTAYIIAASGHKVGEPCSDRTISEMKTNLYMTGNFGARSGDPDIAVRVRSEEPNPPTGLCKVIIEVEENDTIKGINIIGSGPIKIEEIQALLHFTKDKTVFNPNQFLRDTTDIQDLYNRRGYAIAFGQSTGIDEKNPGILNVEIVVTRVGEIKIVKNHKTKKRVILREMKTKAGDYFNRNTLNGDIRRLLNLDLFDDVTPADTDMGGGKIALTISVVEKRTGIVSAGIGFSNRAQLLGRAEITETNFRGMGETVNLLWEAGGAVSRSSVELGFTEPWLDNKHTSLAVQLYDKTVYRFSNSLQNSVASSVNVGTDDRYNEQRTGSTITLSRPIKDTYRGSLSFRGENVKTGTLDLSPANAEIIQNGPIYSISGTLLHNTRDLDVDPIMGGFQTGTIEVGHANIKPVILSNGSPVISSVTGSINYSKASLEARQYFSLSGPRKRGKPDEDKASVAARFIVGSSVGTLPFFEQYFVGGAESLRGFREDRFWGKNMFLGSVEYRHPLARKLKGVLFLDVGDAWGGSYSNVTIAGFNQTGFSLNAGIGAGIRVGTPIGPLRLDFGFSKEGGRTHFSIGNVF